MNYELYKKTKTLTNEELTNFIKSSLNENEYFNCNKENMIGLKEYISELKLKKQKYSEQIKEQLNSIQQKNKWVTDIQPSIDWQGVDIVAKAKNYPSIGIGRFKKDGKFEMTGGWCSPLLIDFLIEMRVRNRRKILSNSQEELKEIEKIINSFDFNNEKEGMLSVSERFFICPKDLDTIDIITNINELSELFYINLNNDESHIYKDSKKVLSKNDSKRLINKIYIKK